MLSSTPSLLSIHSVETVGKHLPAPLAEVRSDLVPLPEEKYPREIEAKKPDHGYYIALGMILSVWMITPLSGAYLVWYIVFRGGKSGQGGLTAMLFAGYAAAEISRVVFAIYHHYLIRFVQSPPLSSNLPLEVRYSLFLRVLAAGLTCPIPTLPRHDPEDSLSELPQEPYDPYASNEIAAMQQDDRLFDSEIDERMGLRERRRVDKTTGGQREVMEDESRKREKALSDEVQREMEMLEEWDGDGIVDRGGNATKLHPCDPRAVEFRERFRTWFNHAPWSLIKKHNVLIWLSWCFFNLPLEDARANPVWSTFLDRSLELLEARTGTTLPDGFDRTISTIRLTMDPVKAKGRPLLLYAISTGINCWLREVIYPFQGMRLCREGPIEYLIRIPKGWTPDKGRAHTNAMPIVYLHGLGFGLIQNHLLIKHLIQSLPTHPLVVPLAHHTAHGFFHERHLRPWTRNEFVETMKVVCRRWGFWEEPQTGMGQRELDIGGVSLMSHSNGSVAHGWIVKDCPSLARRNTFVDPVNFCLWEGDVCWSFCYRKPSKALELLLHYFVASEVGIANYIQRHFDWANNTVFLDEIPHATNPHRTAFFLGAKDMILDASRVRRHLERHGVRAGIHWDVNGSHGDCLSGDTRDRVVMFVGTGLTHGWRGWLREGRRRHSLGQYDWTKVKRDSSDVSTTAVDGNPDRDDSDRTYVGERRKEV